MTTTNTDHHNPRIPAAVRAAGAKSDELMRNFVQKPEGEQQADQKPQQDDQKPQQADQQQVAQQQADQQQADQQKAAQQPNAASIEAELELLKSRYNSQLGRVRSFELRTRELEEKIAQLEHEAEQRKAAAAPDPAKAGVTDEERQEYGEDFLNVVAKAARASVQGELDAANARIVQLEAMLKDNTATTKQSARAALFSHLDKAVPEWQKINKDEGFLSWLAEPDVFSGQTRQTMLNNAFEANDAIRVEAFFTGYAKQVGVVTKDQPKAQGAAKPSLEAFAAPGIAKSAAPPVGPVDAKPIIRRADITKFYKDKSEGAYRGRQAEADAIEAAIFEATREGRVTT